MMPRMMVASGAALRLRRARFRHTLVDATYPPPRGRGDLCANCPACYRSRSSGPAGQALVGLIERVFRSPAIGARQRLGRGRSRIKKTLVG